MPPWHASETTTEDWRAASRLIKALFVQEQYRQCIQICRGILKSSGHDDSAAPPLQKAFTNFYLGLCHDEVARIMHYNSVAKIPSFESAEQHYLEALASLPSFEQTRRLCVQRTKCAHSDPFTNGPNDGYPRSPSVASDFFDRPHSRASSLNLSSPPTHGEVLPSWQSFESPAHTVSDVEDLESHHSYAELMTPSRVQREQSRLSSGKSSPCRSGLPQSVSRHLLPEQTPPANGNHRGLSRMSVIEPDPQYARTNHNTSRFSMFEQRPPAKGLARDLSRMSLIDQSPRSNGLPREASSMSLLDRRPRPHSMLVTSGGAMRPIRVATPPKTFSIPAELKRESSRAKARASLPRLHTQMPWESPLGPPRFARASYTGGFWDEGAEAPVSPVSPNSSISPTGTTISPVSPVDMDVFGRDDHKPVSTPISTPDTPMRDKPPVPPTATYQEHIDEAMLHRVNDDIARIKTQLQRHLESVKRAKAQLRQTQLDRKKRQTLTIGSSPIKKKTGSSPKQLQKARSFWSFVPEDDKAAQKKRRIEEGRARKWERRRFDPRRYQELCEGALEDLAAA